MFKCAGDEFVLQLTAKRSPESNMCLVALVSLSLVSALDQWWGIQLGASTRCGSLRCAVLRLLPWLPTPLS